MNSDISTTGEPEVYFVGTDADQSCQILFEQAAKVTFVYIVCLYCLFLFVILFYWIDKL